MRPHRPARPLLVVLTLGLGCGGGAPSAKPKAPAAMDREEPGAAGGATPDELAMDAEAKEEAPAGEERADDALGEIAAAPSKEDSAQRTRRGITGKGKRLPLVRQSTGEIVTGGGLDAAAIKEVVAAHQDELKACYATGLLADPKLSGTLKLLLTVAPSGTVERAKAEGEDFPDLEVARCIEKAAADWNFPAPGDQAVKISYPLVLAPDVD